MGPFFGLEFETVSTVPRGLAAGRNGKPRTFGTLIQVIKFNFVIVAIGSWAKIYLSHSLLPPRAGGSRRMQGSSFYVRSGSGRVKEPLITVASRLLLHVVWRPPDDGGGRGAMKSVTDSLFEPQG